MRKRPLWLSSRRLVVWCCCSKWSFLADLGSPSREPHEVSAVAKYRHFTWSLAWYLAAVTLAGVPVLHTPHTTPFNSEGILGTVLAHLKACKNERKPYFSSIPRQGWTCTHSLIVGKLAPSIGIDRRLPRPRPHQCWSATCTLAIIGDRLLSVQIS